MKTKFAIASVSIAQTLTLVVGTGTTMNPLLPTSMPNSATKGAASKSSTVSPAPTKTTAQPSQNAITASSTSDPSDKSTSGSSSDSSGNYTPITQTLADGSSYQQGSFNSSLKWQSSGVLQRGGCPVAAAIGDCYSMYLSADGMLEPMDGKKKSKNKAKRSHPRQLDGPSLSVIDPYDSASLGVDSPFEYFQSLLQRRSLLDINLGNDYDTDLDGFKHLVRPETAPSDSGKTFSSACKQRSSATSKGSSGGEGGGGETSNGDSQPAPRQRIEILSWPPAASGETWDYQWKMHVDSRTQTTKGWYHMMQLLQRSGCGGYVIAQDAEKGNVVVKDKNRQCTGGKCASYSYDQYKGRTMLHHLRVTYGEDGVFSYTVVDIGSGKTVLSYSTVGDVGSSSSVKFGIYRAAVDGMEPARAYVGEYAARRMA